MKKFFLYFALTAFTAFTTTNAQAQDRKLVNMTGYNWYSNTWGQLPDGSWGYTPVKLDEPTLYDNYYYYYNSQNQLAIETTYTQLRYIYNDNGTKASKETWNFSNGIFCCTMAEIYEYDEEGNVIDDGAAVQKPLEDINIVKLPEGAALEALAGKLQEQGLSIQTLFANDAPVAELVDIRTSQVTSVNSLEELCDAVTAQGRRGISIQRYKGLGEMSQEELWETTMNPETRTMIQVKVEDAEAADKTFDLLMGTAVSPRRQFIEEHADEVLNPDI